MNEGFPKGEGTWMWDSHVADWVRIYDDGATVISTPRAIWPPENVETR